MKTKMVSLLFVFLLFVMAFPFANAEIDLDPIVLNVGGSWTRNDNAPIETDTYYFITGNSGWVNFLAPETGAYTFYAHCTSGTAYFRFYDEYSEFLGERYLSAGEKVTTEFNFKEGKKYYIHITRNNSWGFDINTACFFSLCAPSEHVQLTERHIAIEADCQKEGYSEQRCVVCKAQLNVETIPMVDHVVGTAKVEKNATCTVAGSLVTRCSVCEETLSTSEIPATGHTGGKKEVLQPATCIATGIEGEMCITCGEVLSTTLLPISDHSAGKMEVIKPATCLESGISEQHCTVCDATLATETPAALGHTPGVWVDEPAATCTADGKRVQHCTVCNVILQEEIVPAHGHRPMDWQITREAGCLQTGLNQKLCSDCGIALETETLDATGHHYTEWEHPDPRCVLYAERSPC